MKSFQELALLEVLKIIKKANNISEPIKVPNEPSEPVEAKNSIGEINNIPVVKSKHTGIIRDGEQKPRDFGLRDAVIIKAIKKAIKKGFSRKTGKTLITYKNKQKKYDLLVASWESNAIVIITVIQDSKDNPKQYFTPKHQKAGDKMITTESLKIQEIQDIKNIIILEED